MESTQTLIDFDRAYKVSGYGGIAWWAVRHPTFQPECQGHPDDGIMDGPCGETFYCDGTCEDIETDYSRVIMRMVGDDRDFDIDVDDIEAIEEDDYCAGCGQIGCGWH